MINLIELIFHFLSYWGAWLGLIIAGVLTWVISKMLWGEFHFELFYAFAAIGITIGFVIQLKTDMKRDK